MKENEIIDSKLYHCLKHTNLPATRYYDQPKKTLMFTFSQLLHAVTLHYITVKIYWKDLTNLYVQDEDKGIKKPRKLSIYIRDKNMETNEIMNYFTSRFCTQTFQYLIP